uniref:RING-type E3 ubiquitin transferase n=1 Tax=Corethron hystrix TaxID=216773 RepID=A0A7S1FWY8_9STRA|mmetsp:Transcript_35745/g.83171  ORF Transcript_35745/g.83171 Transcript_35745/m.83171 type:complete len:1188 (+) Transcript_35745:209-3772(+)
MSTGAFYPYDDVESDDDEPECRVCRGPAEEGRPLHNPCKCSGTIGLVHQSCLESWLAMNPRHRDNLPGAGDGDDGDGDGAPSRYAPRCELCGYHFRWDPLYAPDAPDSLPAVQVLYYGLLRRALHRFLPAAMRVLAALACWLGALPLCTAWLYVGWTKWPSGVLGRAAAVWGDPNDNDDASSPFHKWKLRADRLGDDIISGAIVLAVIVVSFLSLMSFVDFLRVHFHRVRHDPAPPPAEEDLSEESRFSHLADPSLRRLAAEQEAQAPSAPPENQPGGAPPGPRPPPPPPPPPLFDLDDAEENGEGVEIHLALDELLGVRGPPGAMFRNVAWVVLINTTYLGLFVFVPHEIGRIFWPAVRQTVAARIDLQQLPHNLTRTWDVYEKAAQHHDSILQLPDLATILAGYFTMGVSIFVCHAILAYAVKKRKQATDNTLDEDENDTRWWVAMKMAGVAECFAAIFKVATLLFLKMLLLPLVLGAWLDITTLPLFQHTLDHRLQFAGCNLFGALLLHWVAGITFMLLVTVSVLQLREVLHPDLLAQMIRPQEPQPDLLGNLLQDRVATHAKRMTLSLAIYIALLGVFVWVPAALVHRVGGSHFLPFLRLQFCYLLPHQLQVPVELFMFHLCMLAFLEKYKNHIGEMQHYWLVYICGKLGIVESVLPLQVQEFELVAERNLFLNAPCNDTPPNTSPPTDPFWEDFSHTASAPLLDTLLRDYAAHPSRRHRFQPGKSLQGLRVLHDAPEPFQLYLDAPPDFPSPFPPLPSCLGRYRLRIHGDLGDPDPPVLQFWRETTGRPILRPPAGWDDLMGGGAEAQGRWAWGRERRSEVERGTAHRTPLWRGGGPGAAAKLLGKLAVLTATWWAFHLVLIVAALSLPLVAGRHLMTAARVPEGWVHDPLAFPLGLAALCPFVGALHASVVQRWEMVGEGSTSWISYVYGWLKSYHGPPVRKGRTLATFVVLWVVVAPLCCGALFSLFCKENWQEVSVVARVWRTGGILLAIWVYVCYTGLATEEFWNTFRGELPVGVGVAVVAEDPRNIPEEGGPDGENVAAPDVVPQADTKPLTSSQWQGPDGSIALALGCLKEVLASWEWDRVDPHILLEDCAYPMAKNLMVASCGSGCLGLLMSLVAPENDRLMLFRGTVVMVIVLQVSLASRDRFVTWFWMMHKAARDERYLVGRTLRNWNNVAAM